MPYRPNTHLLLYSLWRLEGGSRFVGLEELFEECWKVAPSRFGWSSRPYPSDNIADHALRDVLRDEELKGLVLVSDARTVRLSAEGVSWVRDRLHDFDDLAAQRAPSNRASQRHLIELERSLIGRSLLKGQGLQASRAQVADLLRLTPDADANAFRQRLASYRADAELSGRQDALLILNRLAATRPGWFERSAG